MTLNHRAVKTTWEAHHPCGHRAGITAAFHDLSAKRTSERASYARRLATTDSTNCWRAGRDAAAAQEHARRLAGRRAEEPAETETWETKAAIPTLDSLDKDPQWGRRVRRQPLAAAHDPLGLAEDAFAVRVENPAGRIDSTPWWGWRSWSSQRDTEPGDLEKLVTDTASNETAATSGNPY